MPYKLKNNKHAIEWLKSRKDMEAVIEASYIEVYLGHDSTSHLVCRVKNGDKPVEHRTLFRVRKDFINYWEVKEIETPYINVKKYQLVKLLDKLRKEKVETGLPILKLIQSY